MNNHELSKYIYDQVIAGNCKIRKPDNHYEACIIYGDCYREFLVTLNDGRQYWILSHIGFFSDSYSLQRPDQDKHDHMGNTEYWSKKMFKHLKK